MDLRQLNYIVVIAEELNLTKAAERLFVSQPTLSLYLNRLEKELGIPLFIRQNNRLVITPGGVRYVETAKKMLEMKKELYRELHITSEEPVLNIGISSLFMQKILSEIFPEFKAMAPHFQVNVTEGRATSILEKMNAGLLDVAIVGRENIIQDERYRIQVLLQEECFLFLPPTHPHADVASADFENPPEADMSLFSGENFVLAPHDTSDYQIAQHIFRDYNMNANVICEINNNSTIIQMVMSGLCLTIGPSYSIERDSGLLACRPSKPYYRYMLCFQHKNKKLSKEGALFLRMLTERYHHYYNG